MPLTDKQAGVRLRSPPGRTPLSAEQGVAELVVAPRRAVAGRHAVPEPWQLLPQAVAVAVVAAAAAAVVAVVVAFGAVLAGLHTPLPPEAAAQARGQHRSCPHRRRPFAAAAGRIGRAAVAAIPRAEGQDPAHRWPR